MAHVALWISRGCDLSEQGTAGLACVEEVPDPVVAEASEPEGCSLGALDEVVHRVGRVVSQGVDRAERACSPDCPSVSF